MRAAHAGSQGSEHSTGHATTPSRDVVSASPGPGTSHGSRSAIAIRPEGLAGNVLFQDTGDDDYPVGLAKVRSRFVRHVGPTLGFRIDWAGASVAYVPDHGPGCCPDDPDDFVPHEILELCDGVDVLIHDAQHTAEEYAVKRHWGHSTVEYAVHVAKESGAKHLVLFHHDPAHGDDVARPHPVGRARGEPNQRIPDVTDRAVGHQPLDVLLSDCGDGTEHHRCDRQKDDDLTPLV